jgi:hypothetical protein
MDAELLPRGGVALREGVVLMELMLRCRGVGTGLEKNSNGNHLQIHFKKNLEIIYM